MDAPPSCSAPGRRPTILSIYTCPRAFQKERQEGGSRACQFSKHAPSACPCLLHPPSCLIQPGPAKRRAHLCRRVMLLLSFPAANATASNTSVYWQPTHGGALSCHTAPRREGAWRAIWQRCSPGTAGRGQAAAAADTDQAAAAADTDQAAQALGRAAQAGLLTPSCQVLVERAVVLVAL